MSIFKNSKKILVLFILTCFIGNSSLFLVDVQASGTITYTGYVRNVSGVGLSGASVDIYIDDDEITRHSHRTTDSSGYYSISRSYSLAEGSVSVALIASKSGYDSESYSSYVPSGSYAHNFVLSVSVPEPSLSWVSPANNALITFTPGSNSFTFTYSAANMDNVKLYIGPNGAAPTVNYGTFTNMGTNIQKTVTIGNVGELHGIVRVDIRGYTGATKVKEVTRTFNFSVQIFNDGSLIDSGYHILGNQLYLILYDPMGDQSYSTHTTETKVIRTNSVEVEVGVGISAEASGALFGVPIGTSFSLDTTYGHEYEWAQTDIKTTILKSSLNSAERDLVGPGYGDMYWGAWEKFQWELWANNITYVDGSKYYSGPVLNFGTDYSSDILVSHQLAIPEWLEQNPNVNTDLYDDPSIVDWTEINKQFQGGTGSSEKIYEEVSSTSTTNTFTIELTNAINIGVEGVAKSELELSLKARYQHNVEESTSVKTSYFLHDDDSGDYFHYDVGTDLRYGVPIIRNTPNEDPMFQSKSSTPWEHNTIDYLDPVTTDITITLDTDGDNISPTEDDTPLVEAVITDEGNISAATIFFSADGGTTWDYEALEERANDVNHWYGYIPGHEHGTTIIWYIYALDNNGNSEIFLDPDSEYFEYTIISRPPTVELLSPNLGGIFENSIQIDWTGSDPDDDSLTYTIGYQIDGGGWVLLVSDLTNNSYIWDISGFADSAAVSLIVYADDGFCATVSDQCEFVFEIDNEDVPEVTFVSPLPGFIYDGTITVNWALVDIDEFVTGFELYFLPASGESWVLIENSIASNILTFDWNTSAIVYSQTVRLKIVTLNSLNVTIETISGLIKIDNRPTVQMNLINPNGGEIFTAICSITWNVDYTNPLIIYQISLEYSNDSQVWTSIISGINGTTYDWDTTSVLTGANYRVRITLTGSYLGVELDSIVDISENAFLIVDETGSIAIPFFNLFALFALVLIPSVLFKKRK